MSGGDFWSRRRAAVEAEAQAEAQALAVAELAEAESAQAEKTDEELLQELGLPDPDSLGKGDDFTVFLAKAVPARIRTRALRRLWISDPVLANIDGLVDYGEDFTDAAMALENVQTAYQVGKGMTAHVEEMARQAEAQANAEAEADGAAETSAEPAAQEPAPEAQAEDAPELERAAPPAEPAPPAAEEDHQDDMLIAAAPRRMRFQFDPQGAEA
jgi:hypothetical protein